MCLSFEILFIIQYAGRSLSILKEKRETVISGSSIIIKSSLSNSSTGQQNLFLNRLAFPKHRIQSLRVDKLFADKSFPVTGRAYTLYGYCDKEIK